MTDIENTEVNNLPQDNQQTETPELPEITLENVKEGKIDFHSLPKNEKTRLKSEYLNTVEDDREKEALLQGHSPKFMFLGKNRDGTDRPWEDHETFLRKIETQEPVKNERLRALTKDKEEMQQQIKKLIDLNKAQFQRSLANDELAVEKELHEAEEYADIPRFKQAQEKKTIIEREKLRLKSFEEENIDVPLPPVPNAPPILQREVAEFAARNSTIVSTPDLLAYAKAMDGAYSVTHKDLPLAERLKMVEDATKQAFPSYFPEHRRSAVDTARSNNTFGSKPKTKSFADLPEIERQQARSLIKHGIFKNEADFLKTYEWK